MNCEIPILKQPPDDLINTQKDAVGTQNAWLLCTAISMVNQMLHAYKNKFCPAGTANLEPKVRLIQTKVCPTDPSIASDCGCGSNVQNPAPTCWQLAQMEQSSEAERENPALKKPLMALKAQIVVKKLIMDGSNPARPYKAGPCINGWKKHENAVVFTCTKKHACAGLPGGLDGVKAECLKNKDCRGVREAGGSIEMRAGAFGKSDAGENAHVWCGTDEEKKSWKPRPAPGG